MKLRKILTSIVILILVFLCFSIKPVQASFFDKDDDKSEIEKTIDEDERRTF